MRSLDEFRRYVETWLSTHADELIAAAQPDEFTGVVGAASRAAQQALFEAGLVGITWPAEYGGQGLPPEAQAVFDRAVASYELPTPGYAVGLGMCGPTILALGTGVQKQRYLRPLLRGEEIWCQLFSEPGAGSDLAGIELSAVADADGAWHLNGQKVWTSGAQQADFGLVLARTDRGAPKHAGITMFIADMRTPGVEVRPLRVATGDTPFCEVFFEAVTLPADAVLGEVNGGWRAALVTLSSERSSIGTYARPGDAPLGFDTLVSAARRTGAVQFPAVREALVDLAIGERALASFNRLLAGVDPQVAGPFGSIAKLVGSRLDALAAQIGRDTIGAELAAYDPAPRLEAQVHDMIAPLEGAIGGGTSQIQLNIIAERILGLPKDPGPDRSVPFDQLRVGTQR